MFRFYSHNSSFVHGGLDNTGKVGWNTYFRDLILIPQYCCSNLSSFSCILSFMLQSVQDAQDAEAAAVYGQQEIHQKIMQVGQKSFSWMVNIDEICCCIQYQFLSSWTSGTATQRSGRWTPTRPWPMGWLSRYFSSTYIVLLYNMQTLELTDSLWCVVECWSIARLNSPIAFGDQNLSNMVLDLVRRNNCTDKWKLH